VWAFERYHHVDKTHVHKSSEVRVYCNYGSTETVFFSKLSKA